MVRVPLLGRLLCRFWTSVNSDDDVSSVATLSNPARGLGDRNGLLVFMGACSAGI